MEKHVVIIGGGASGMMAAIQAARAGAKVTVLEHMDRVGKKILSTGNGRCNLTNRYQEPECYRCSQPGFVQTVLKQFSVEETIGFFEELGVLIKDRGGYLYPNSDQASTVLDVLRMELEHLNVKVKLGCQVKQIKRSGHQFVVRIGDEQMKADALILAAGSKAAPVTGSDGSGYELAAELGHRIITPLPALVQLRCKEKHYKQLAGIRTEVQMKLLASGKRSADGMEELAAERGELQLTDYGISGIPTFQISRYAAIALNQGRKVTVVIDFLPQLDQWQAEKLLNLRVVQLGYKTCEDWMTGLLNKKLGTVLLKLAGIQPQRKASEVSKENWKQLFKLLKAYETQVIAVNPFENAQICCGGVDTREIMADTMESKLIPGLYMAGEILDVDGICGGYNLQWAWSSGAVAGRSAAGAGRTCSGKKQGN